jgi:hypothetical protein
MLNETMQREKRKIKEHPGCAQFKALNDKWKQRLNK